MAGKFRFHGTSCLLTYNGNFTEAVFADFVLWVKASERFAKWTATLEESLHSPDATRRFHIHLFVEFIRAVDWTTLRPVAFNGITPDCRPTMGRGPRQRECLDNGHFYCWAWKVGTIAVETSGYEPWVHYTVKGQWIDALWSAHNLSHSTYVEYALLARI